MSGILAEKIGMTQIYTKDGLIVPVTVLRAGPCVVVMKRLPEKDGYGAIQIGFDEVNPKRVSKAESGHFLKKQLKVHRHLKEIRANEIESYSPGDQITVADFKVGDSIDVRGVSKGKGFQGVVKRHHFGGGPQSHGCSVSHRVPGSIGQNTYPGRVIKGKRMPGHMGCKNVTIQNLKIVSVEVEENLILVRGAVPGANRSIVEVYPRDKEFGKRFIEKKQQNGKKENGEGQSTEGKIEGDPEIIEKTRFPPSRE